MNARCPLCGADGCHRILSTCRLDGPLCRCPDCDLVFVALDRGGEGLTGAGTVGEAGEADDGVVAAMDRLAVRARQLELIDEAVEVAEAPWRVTMGGERLADLLRFIDRGELLEVGCSSGEFLQVAAAHFGVTGVEADRTAAAIARSRGIDCRNGGLTAAGFPGDQFDVAVLYHVVEHFRDPRAELRELRRILRPGGHLIIETPDVDNPWFRLLGARWRQIIPDHLFFFSPTTIRRLLEEEGFHVTEIRHVGKSMSLRLFISRVGRYASFLAGLLGHLVRLGRLEHRTLRLNLGDVMRLHAIKDPGKRRLGI